MNISKPINNTNINFIYHFFLIEQPRIHPYDNNLVVKIYPDRLYKTLPVPTITF